MSLGRLVDILVFCFCSHGYGAHTFFWHAWNMGFYKMLHITFAKIIRHFASILQIRLYTMAFHFIFITLSAHILMVINNLEQNDKCGGCVPKCYNGLVLSGNCHS